MTTQSKVYVGVFGPGPDDYTAGQATSMEAFKKYCAGVAADEGLTYTKFYVDGEEEAEVTESKFKVGDRVRIKQGKKQLGPTVWVITELLPACGCMIQEADTDYAAQRFDTSLLVRCGAQ